jgi:hypothetical protein
MKLRISGCIYLFRKIQLHDLILLRSDIGFHCEHTAKENDHLRNPKEVEKTLPEKRDEKLINSSVLRGFGC